MKYKITLFLFFVLICVICVNCRRLQVPIETVSQVETEIENVETAVADNRLYATFNWEKDDHDPRTVGIISPPEATIQPSLKEYHLTLSSRNRLGKTCTATLNKAEAEEKFGAKTITNAILDQIVITPRGFLRYNYIQSIKITPEISQRTLKLNKSDINEIYIRQLSVNLEMLPPSSDLPVGAAPTGKEFSRLLSHLVINPEMAKHYSLSQPPLHTSEKETNVSGETLKPSAVINLYVNQEKIYRIDRDMLIDSGLNPDNYDPLDFHLYNKEEEIPLFPWGCRAGRFTERDALLFYGFPIDEPQTGQNVFRLVYDPASEPLRMEIIGNETSGQAEKIDHHIGSQIIEEDHVLKIHAGNFLSIKGMRWIWQRLPFAEDFKRKFILPGFINLPLETKSVLHLYNHPGEFTTPMKVELSINDSESFVFDVRRVEDDEFEFSIPSRFLNELENEFTLNVLPSRKTSDAQKGKPTGIYLDKIVINYPSRFIFHLGRCDFKSLPFTESSVNRHYTLDRDPGNQIVGIDHADSGKPRYIITKKTGARQRSFTIKETSPGDYSFILFDAIERPEEFRPVKYESLASSQNEADYLIISHPDFIPAARKLSAFRKQQGFKVKIVDVETIYDEFGYGILSPFAIKRFLQAAMINWKNPPVYVLLVGDATSDYKNEARNDVRNFIPAFIHHEKVANQDKWASEHWYSTLLGDDQLPDVLIGRISVNNKNDAENVINKIIHYEKNPVMDPWRITLGFVADDGPFDEDAEKLRTEDTPEEFIGETVYLENLPLEDNFYLDRSFVESTRAKVSSEATARILSLFQNGVTEMSYFGHGSPNIWTDERIWFGGDSVNSDNLHLTNKDRLTFVTNMTCNSGAIDYPVPKWNVCISEDAMRQKDGGAIAQFVPSGPGFSSSHVKLSAALRKALYEKRIKTLGDAVALARCLYLLEDNPEEIMQMFILLGDPALDLQMPGEKIKLSSSMESISKQELPAKISINTTAPFSKGIVYYFLFSPDNEMIEKSGEKKFSQPNLTYDFLIPANSAEGKWTVKCYLHDVKKKIDAAGCSSFFLDSPWLKMEDPRIVHDGETITIGEEVDLCVNLKNPSMIEYNQASLHLEQLEPNGNAINMSENNISPGQYKVFSHKVTAMPGLNIYRFRISEDAAPGDSTVLFKFSETVAFATALDDKTSNSRLMTSSHLIEKHYNQVHDNIRMTLSIPIYNAGNMPSSPFEIRLRNGLNPSGAVLKTMKSGSIQPGDHRDMKMNVTISEIQEKKKFRLEIIPEESNAQSDAEPSEDYIPIVYEPETLPDVKIVEIVPSEESPTEGKTIFFDITIANGGKGPASDFTICLYDDDPSSAVARKLFNYLGSPETMLDYLRPGGSQKYRLRWDPVNNAGKRNIYAKVDARNQIAEINEENNVLLHEIYVRSKADLKVRGIEARQTPEEEENLVARLVAKVANEGETAAGNVSVRFFKSRYQSPETLIGENLIPEIRPGETAETIYEWKLTKDEARFIYNPSIQVFLKGSSQRLSSVPKEEQIEEPEDETESPGTPMPEPGKINP